MHSPLRQLARSLEAQKPSSSYMLAHLNPTEIKMLEQVSGPGRPTAAGVRRFATGGAVPSSISDINNNYATAWNAWQNGGFNSPELGLNYGGSEADWVASPYFQSFEDQLISAIGGVDDYDWLSSDLLNQQARASDPLYGASAARIAAAMQARLGALSPPTPTGGGAVTNPDGSETLGGWTRIPILGNDGSVASYRYIDPNQAATITSSAYGPWATATSGGNTGGAATPPVNTAPQANDYRFTGVGGHNYVTTPQRPVPQGGGAYTPAQVPAAQVPAATPLESLVQVQTRNPQPLRMAAGGLAQHAEAVRSRGRWGDSELAFITPEQADLLKKAGGSGGINPNTGLREFGFLGKLLKTVVRVGATVAGFMYGGPAGAAAASAASTKLTGGSWKSALISGAVAGVTGGLTNAIAGQPLMSAGNAWGTAAGTSGLSSGASSAGGMTIGSLGAGGATPIASSIASSAAPASSLVSSSLAPAATSGLGALSGTSGLVLPAAASSAATPAITSSLLSAPAAGAGASSLAGTSLAPTVTKSFGTRALDWLTDPLFFKDATGTIGSAAKMLSSPLGLGALAYLATDKPKGNASDYTEFLKAQAAQNAAADAMFREAFNQPPLDRRLDPNAKVDIGYGFRPESNFWIYGQDKKPGFAVGGLAALAPNAYSGPIGKMTGPMQGPGGGQDDLIDAKLSPGEFVFDATTVADLGDGSTEEGNRKLEALRQAIKRRKGRMHRGAIPPKSPSVKELVMGVS